MPSLTRYGSLYTPHCARFSPTAANDSRITMARARSMMNPTMDRVDCLDHSFGLDYHHEGPFDATFKYRNQGMRYPPISAVARSTQQTIQAVPPESLIAALVNHEPVDDMATIPPSLDNFYEEEILSDLQNFEHPSTLGFWPGEEFASAGTKYATLAPEYPVSHRSCSHNSLSHKSFSHRSFSQFSKNTYEKYRRSLNRVARKVSRLSRRAIARYYH